MEVKAGWTFEVSVKPVYNDGTEGTFRSYRVESSEDGKLVVPRRAFHDVSSRVKGYQVRFREISRKGLQTEWVPKQQT